MFGSPETTPGGRALKFYSSVRLDVRRIETLKDGTDAVGNRVRVKVVKNKVAPPFRQAEFDIIYGEGISKEGSLIDVGVEEAIIRKAGAWYTYDGEQLGQGKEKARLFLKENVDIALEIEKKVKEKLGRAKGHAPLRLRQDLAKRGFDPQLIDQVLAPVEAEDQEAAAFAVAKDKADRLTGVDAETALRRTVAHVARRGYPEGLARKVARAAVDVSRDAQRAAGH
jgi:hypothetical protein